MRYRVRLAEPGRVQLLFNSPEPMRAWFDGRGVLSRDGGPFIPAMHRAPADQIVTLDLDAGEHEIVAMMRRPGGDRPLTWCVGLGDVKPSRVCNDWLVGVFDRPGAAG